MPSARGIRRSDAADLQHGLPPGHHQCLYRWDQSGDILRWFDDADNYRPRGLCADHFGWELHAEPLYARPAHTPARFEDRAMIAPAQRSSPPASRSWIVERGTQTPGGGGAIPSAPGVVIDSTTVTDRHNDLVEVDVTYHVPSATPATYAGAAVFIEDPDISSQAPMKLDGSTKLDGTSQVSGTWSPFQDNNIPAIYNASNVFSNGPAAIMVPAEDQDRSIRIYM